MHLEFDRKGKASPNNWVVIDDFGTEHDASSKGSFCGYSDQPAIQRRGFRHSEDHDPDVNRAHWCWPRFYSVRESTAFASSLGMSIEVEIRIDFELIPAWDERYGEERLTQADGATIRVLYAGTNEWEFRPASTVLTSKTIEAFCWAYIEMEKAREAAGSSRREIQ
ncbi:hypothetical protein K2O51_23455 [Cupriavidus pinatubonensis]|uniref:hypothetical protein n=1 Tax=Cupriavidus pinatubonensis TaxID=248026 RepID=UPI001C72D402|nr:hypothetical protein [Cupriavidus pinatubonensis]QYY30329.1 hypothetical protein K2O51_23455 [Cupriavidus pinatubonensis]